MARFATLTGLNNEKFYFNLEHIAYLERVQNSIVPGDYVPSGNYEWTIVHLEGQPEGVPVQEKVGDILTASLKK